MPQHSFYISRINNLKFFWFLFLVGVFFCSASISSHTCKEYSVSINEEVVLVYKPPAILRRIYLQLFFYLFLIDSTFSRAEVEFRRWLHLEPRSKTRLIFPRRGVFRPQATRSRTWYCRRNSPSRAQRSDREMPHLSATSNYPRQFQANIVSGR